jgi:hypothetical protein
MTTPSTPELLAEMARLTALSNRISEVQEKNLKLYPLVFFNKVLEVKVNYDLTSKADILEDSTTDKIIINAPSKNHFVAYHLVLDESENQDLDKRFLALEKSVRNLFWNDVSVEVYFNGQIKYKSIK